MAETATHLFDNIESPTLNGSSPEMNVRHIPGRGRPTLDAYLEPEEIEEIAVTSDKILENYPFFGTLLKQEHGHYRRKEVITRQNPQTIEQIEQVYGPGKYQVRLKKENGTEDQLHFHIHDSGPEIHSVQEQHNPQSLDQQFIESIRRDIREETRRDFEQIIDTLEKRLKSKDGELDDMVNKVRRLTIELTESERQSNSLVRNETSAFQEKIEQLKEEIQELKFENFELQQELKYADVDTGFDLKEILNDALKNPELFNLISPLIQKFQPAQPQPQPLAGLNQPKPSENSPKESTQPENKSNPAPEQNNPENNMQYIVNQFFSQLVQTVTSALVQGQPGPETIRRILNEGLRTFETHNINAEPGFWIQVSKTLMEVATNHDIPAQKAADVIAPVLEQFNGAADQLKYIPAKAAAEFVIGKYGVQLNEQHKAYFIELLKEFKNRLKAA
ncbi:hypothetical protein [Rhodohalobacter barkolensis]|uniref:Uncharacterized protein n=1 Tax=Rhodohalobacter barkolensis TaxID=2053187 RepID=A0A2N0VHU7_9BACT|nr:hypothetical protein [Rhodohalobacter barkolensis]PKD43763.1 hypothetical protein CWD77_09395 [Rhodohalobacter barkolensis]